MLKIQVDPYFNDIPWEIIYDDLGRPIGEVFLVPFKECLPIKFKRRNRRNGPLKVNPRDISKLQKYFKSLTDPSNKVTSIAPVREIEMITIVRTLDMLGLDIQGINNPN